MTDRPTPEQIIDGFAVWPSSVDDDGRPLLGGLVIGALLERGYVIVHPDDVPETFPAPESLFGCTYEEAYEFGNRKMRSHIFGGDR